MSIPAELWRKVQLILGQSEPKRMYRAGSEVFSGEHCRHRLVNEVSEKPLYELVNAQVELLIRLYASVAATEQAVFNTTMIANLDAENAPIIAHALIELRGASQLHYWERVDESSEQLIQAITDKLAVEHWKFTDEDIEHVASACHRLKVKSRAIQEDDKATHDEVLDAERMERLTASLERVINRVRYVRLASGLMQLRNPVVDRDRHELRSRLKTLHFNPKLVEALNELERRTAVAATEFEFKSAMELLRTFFEEFIEEAATRSATTSSVPFPSGEKLSHFAPYNDYLRTAGVTGREEQELLQKLYNYISNKGSHALGSAPEQFHVARTTVIEWCMLIAGRVTTATNR